MLFIPDLILAQYKDAEASRIGGEEFLLILPHTKHVDALLVAEKIRVQFEQLSLLAVSPSYTVTDSFGVAECNQASEFNQAVKQADQQLYLSKHTGSNKVS